MISLIDLLLIMVFIILAVYTLSVGIVIFRNNKRNDNNKQRQVETNKRTQVEIKETICPKCNKSYDSPRFEFEEMYKNNSGETLIKSISKCPNCKAELGTRIFSSEKGEIIA